MAKASWVGKAPADMSMEELRAAKEELFGRLVPTQDALNVLSAAVTHLDREINERFRMVSQPSALGALPVYPMDDLNTMFGGNEQS